MGRTKGKHHPWRWDARKHKVAVMLAENEMSQNRISQVTGVSYDTITAWRNRDEFMEKVRELEKDLENEMMRLPIAKKRKRMATYQDMENRLIMLLQDREAAYAADDSIIGGRTGVVVKQTKAIGMGKNQQIIEEYAFDQAVYRELRAVNELAAKETGQLTDKHEISGPDGGPIRITDIVVDRSSVGGRLLDEDEEIPDDV